MQVQLIIPLSTAIKALERGDIVARTGWNGSGMFITKQIPSSIGLEIIPKMQSLPESTKDILLKRETPIHYGSQMLIVKNNGTANSWVPSSSDVFAKDWFIVKG